MEHYADFIRTLEIVEALSRCCTGCATGFDRSIRVTEDSVEGEVLSQPVRLTNSAVFVLHKGDMTPSNAVRGASNKPAVRRLLD